MPKLFKLIKEEFSDKYQEQWWTYACLFEFIFNDLLIAEITITDHLWKKKGREKITKELVLNILKKELNGRRVKPTNYHGKKKVFIRERVYYLGKRYWLNFWFKDGTTNHLWIRNCYRKDD